MRYTFGNNYFNDTYQGVPIDSYNRLIDGLLKGVDTQTGVDFFDGMDKTWYNVAYKLVFTGKIDDFYHQR